VLETDAPFLTPSPLRGKINLPAYVGRVAEHQAMLKGVSFDVVVDTTNHNAKQLFNLN
jgi:TatD DNase family protein